MPLDAAICHVQLVFYEVRPKLLLFLAQIKDKQIPPNDPQNFFKKVDTSLFKMQIKFGLWKKGTDAIYWQKIKLVFSSFNRVHYVFTN